MFASARAREVSTKLALSPHTCESARAPAGRFSRLFRFGRALVVGSGATLVDFAVLMTCIRILDMTPALARAPALVAGASFQFFGHRSFTFRARSGGLSRQAKLFISVEIVALVLNLSLYEALLTRVHALPPEILSFVGSFLVFVTFAYPMHRRLSFALPPTPPGSSCSA